MSIVNTSPVIFMDEGNLAFEHTRTSLQRMAMRLRFAGGLWAIGEEFNDRFDTEVGGTVFMVSQSINADNEAVVHANPLENMQTRPARIVDYDNHGATYTEEEAEGKPELAAVLQRLRERIAAYEALHSRSNKP